MRHFLRHVLASQLQSEGFMQKHMERIWLILQYCIVFCILLLILQSQHDLALPIFFTWYLPTCMLSKWEDDNPWPMCLDRKMQPVLRLMGASSVTSFMRNHGFLQTFMWWMTGSQQWQTQGLFRHTFNYSTSGSMSNADGHLLDEIPRGYKFFIF